MYKLQVEVAVRELGSSIETKLDTILEELLEMRKKRKKTARKNNQDT